MRIFNLPLCLLFCFIVSACQLTASKNTQTTQLIVQFADRDSMSFEGKGAGAGMMLMSSMGAMGVAIGVAIDEGIAKDIEASMNAENYTIEALIQGSLSRQLPKQQWVLIDEQVAEEDVNAIAVTINDYGFRLGDGDNDPAYANISLTIEQAGKQYKFHFPKDFESSAIQTGELESLKVDGHKSAKLIQASLDKIFAVWEKAN